MNKSRNRLPIGWLRWPMGSGFWGLKYRYFPQETLQEALQEALQDALRMLSGCSQDALDEASALKDAPGGQNHKK